MLKPNSFLRAISEDSEPTGATSPRSKRLRQRLHFPGHFGPNLDALNDCMRDVASHEYGWHADATGLVIVLRAFDSFATLDRRTAHTLLGIVADQARCAIGNRIICLVQSNDPS
jgi:RNAse (barnase) inhibitor barstar